METCAYCDQTILVWFFAGGKKAWVHLKTYSKQCDIEGVAWATPK